MQKRCLLSAFATGTLAPLQLFALMWFSADILGLFSINVFPFSRNVVLSALSFLANVVRKSGCFWAGSVSLLSGHEEFNDGLYPE